MSAIRKTDKNIRDMHFLFTFMMYFCLIIMPTGGCSHSLDLNAPRKELDYVICPPGHLPRELKDMAEKRKRKPCTFSYNNTKYTYLVVCYGSQEYSGYSIRVEECSEGDRILYLKTLLVGPAAGEPVVQKETWPYIVIQCDRSEKLCVLES